MKLYFYRGAAPNFGDELNTELMPLIFPDFFDQDEDPLFLAIGSILFQGHPTSPLKIVFGSGYGGYAPPPILDEKWKVYCVRGPRTAKTLGLGADAVAADAAILINRFRKTKSDKIHRCSFIPHWESLYRGNWANVCHLAGVNFIDPRDPVEEVLQAIESSDMVVVEAMHGAIVADALRVPWVPVIPFHKSHRFKWYDWAEALDLKLEPKKLAASSVVEAWMSTTGGRGDALKNLGGPLKSLVNTIDRGLNHTAASSLSKLAASPTFLSSDQSLERAMQKLETNAAAILRDFRR